MQARDAYNHHVSRVAFILLLAWSMVRPGVGADMACGDEAPMPVCCCGGCGCSVEPGSGDVPPVEMPLPGPTSRDTLAAALQWTTSRVVELPQPREITHPRAARDDARGPSSRPQARLCIWLT